jgi:hypothetical protein
MSFKRRDRVRVYPGTSDEKLAEFVGYASNPSMMKVIVIRNGIQSGGEVLVPSNEVVPYENG